MLCSLSYGRPYGVEGNFKVKLFVSVDHAGQSVSVTVNPRIEPQWRFPILRFSAVIYTYNTIGQKVKYAWQQHGNPSHTEEFVMATGGEITVFFHDSDVPNKAHVVKFVARERYIEVVPTTRPNQVEMGQVIINDRGNTADV